MSYIISDPYKQRKPYCLLILSLNNTFRFTINGEDQGVASTNVPSNVRAVIELTGHISQVRNLFLQI